ncbi:MAG: hypothetical protein CML30_12665 [Rhizobiales bacterium]|nr:hypothetical protein [Hyphomicrobiales bacterium]
MTGFRLSLAVLTLATATALYAPAAPSLAQDADTEITAISERLLFVVSGGYWEELPEEEAEATSGESAAAPAPSEESETEEPAETVAPADDAAEPAAPKQDTTELDTTEPARRGYYRLVALRAADNSSRVYLQQMALGDGGPTVEMTTEIGEFSAEPAYVTNIVQEGSGQAGFSAFVYAKSDPSLPEPDTWTVFVDEFGELTVEKATN